MIALLSSVPEEGNILSAKLRKKSLRAGKLLYQGRINGQDTAYMVSGMGKVNAAHATTLLIEEFSPTVVVLFGLGGAYPSTGLGVGDIAVAEKEVYGDEGVFTKSGFQGTDFMGIPFVRKGGKEYFNEFVLDWKLASKAVRSLKDIPSPLPFATAVQSGTFVTVSTCSGTLKRGMELKGRHDAICENMEGAAVAHICALYETPMIEIRGISNMVEDRDRRRWNIPLAAEQCQTAVIGLLKAHTLGLPAT